MAKQNSSGLKLSIMDGTPTPVSKLITEQLTFSENRTTATIDVTSKDNGGFEEFLGGLKSGEVSCEFIADLDISGQADKLNYLELQAINDSRAIKTYVASALSPLGKTLKVQFNGLLTAFNLSAPLEDKITVSMTIKRSGGVTTTLT